MACDVCELHFSDDAIRRYTEAETGPKTDWREDMCALKALQTTKFCCANYFYTDFPTYLSNSGNPLENVPRRDCKD
ncbi:hypothetical protein TNCV_4741231 [Trichonephila clavipes]|nr:hypothetical protein TNCV_4741231 [Trichonephila clavipes]